MREAVIVSTARTPLAKSYRGAFNDTEAPVLSGHCVRHAVAQDAAGKSAAVSHAKIAAGDAAMGASKAAIQCHGAMGYTYEVDLHLWMKRAWALIGAWGDRDFHMKRIAEFALGGNALIGAGRTFGELDKAG